MVRSRSRLSLDRSTNLPSIHTFAQLSQFLRASVADEDSRLFSESMRSLSVQLEGVIDAMRASRERATLAPMLMDLLTVLRNHRQFVVDLGLEWRALYEYAAYLHALNNFRVLIGQWLLDRPESAELGISAEEFERIAWRTLGEGLLLIDMYEQWLGGDAQHDTAPVPNVTEPQLDRAMQWWKKLGF